MTLKIRESHIKKSLTDYLTYKQNAGLLWWTRLNSGSLLVENKDGSKRRVQLCPEGTADFIVIQGSGDARYEDALPDVYFLETKTRSGKQTPAQKDFQARVEAEGCHYILVRDIEQVKEMFE